MSNLKKKTYSTDDDDYLLNSLEEVAFLKVYCSENTLGFYFIIILQKKLLFLTASKILFFRNLLRYLIKSPERFGEIVFKVFSLVLARTFKVLASQKLKPLFRTLILYIIHEHQQINLVSP